MHALNDDEKAALTRARLEFEEHGRIPIEAARVLLLFGLNPQEIEERWVETAYR